MNKNIFLTVLLILFSISTESFAAPQTNTSKRDTSYIFLRDYGLYKTKKRDAVKIINKALEDIKGDDPKVLVFTPGVYHFYPDHCLKQNYYESNTTDINPKICAFLFKNINNLIIDGRGSTLVFHEQMQPFTFDNCSNVTLKNLNIDWENPLIAQGQVLKVNQQFIDLAIDQREFPHSIDEGKLMFVVNRQKKNIWKGTMEFDKEGRYVVPQTGDRGCLGRNWQDYTAQATMPGIVRLHNDFERKPKVGNILVLRHAERAHSGVFIYESKDITIKSLNLFHATGLGILAQFSEDLTFNKYRAVPNRKKNHYFGGGDDGLQVSNCKGQITITNCEFEGLMDDPVNVHGTSVRIEQIISETEIKCKFMHHQSSGLNWGHPNDKISFIENEQMNSIARGEIQSFRPVNKDHFILTLKNPIPKQLEIGDALENLTWSPNLLVKDSHFKSCRARGLLVSTPGEVQIENNIFESSGSAILIAGDANGWFESGAVTNLTIANNTFTELCNTSSYQFCEGIISIFPIIPKLGNSTPTFHSNIKIINNRFTPFDFPILYALSVDGITFTNNTITRSSNFKPYHQRQHNLTFEFCKNINVSENILSDDLLGKNILLNKTPILELHLGDKSHFQVKTIDNN